MSTHPNAILLLVLTPDDLVRKTYRAILAASTPEYESEPEDILIGEETYHVEVMESDYDDSWQISAPEGSIIVFDLFTYGYGDKMTWSKLEANKNALEAWAKDICEKFHCSYEIFLTANYW